MVAVEWLGRVAYDKAWALQKALVAQKGATPTEADKLLLLEHPPTYTFGRSGKESHLLLDETALAEGGFTRHWVDRGGDITYHGPGQLVGYPILNLKALHKQQLDRNYPDLHRYLRDIEEVIIQTIATFGIHGWRYEGYTGVWVDTADGPRKLAAIGIKVSSKGISSHGFALNVNPDMTHFAHIVPCGIQEHGVISLAELLLQPITVSDLLIPIKRAFADVMAVEVSDFTKVTSLTTMAGQIL